MMRVLYFLSLTAWPAALALSPTFLPCQLVKPTSISPLAGCPPGTIFVSQDTSNPFAQFNKVQDAILSLPEEGNATILIAAGEYYETVNITRSGPVTLLGQLPANARERATTSSADPFTPNLVKIWNNQYVKQQGVMDNAETAVLIVAPSFEASLIGSGPTGAPLQPLFGNKDFKAYNIDFQNKAADFAISQVLVTDISYANASFYGCSFASYQDTWYTGRNASTYVVDSVIYGQTDYLFGFGTAWFQNVILANRACGGGIVAWKGTNQTNAPGNRYGAYIADSQIIRSPDANSTTATTGRCYLGRPWNDLATTVFLRTYMDESVRPEGWTAWGGTRPAILNTTFYAEYASSALWGRLVTLENTGSGGSASKRIPEGSYTH